MRSIGDMETARPQARVHARAGRWPWQPAAPHAPAAAVRLKLTAQLCRAIPVGTAGVLIVEGTEDPSFPEPHPERTVDITLGGMSGMPVVVA